MNAEEWLIAIGGLTAYERAPSQRGQNHPGGKCSRHDGCGYPAIDCGYHRSAGAKDDLHADGDAGDDPPDAGLLDFN